MFPRFSKNFFLCIVYPELKINGGSIKFRKKLLLNLKWSAMLEVGVENHNIREIIIPKIIVYDVSWPILGWNFS